MIDRLRAVCGVVRAERAIDRRGRFGEHRCFGFGWFVGRDGFFVRENGFGGGWMIKAVELRKGKTVLHDGQVCVVHAAQHVAKGNKRSYMQTKLKNIKSGVISEVRFNVDERLETPFVETKEYEFLYHDGQDYIVMDQESYEQLPLSADLFGESVRFLKPNEKVTAMVIDGQIVGVELPNVVELEVTDAPPVVKGATVTNQPKDVTLETGAKVRVPAFISAGERVRVDTRTGDYIDRVK